MGPKRKAESELSTNQHTKRGRARRDAMTEAETELHNAKKADTANILHHTKKLQKTEEWQNASDAEKKAMKDRVAEERIRIR